MSQKTTAVFGRTAREVSRIGLGCMGLSGAYGTADDEQSIKTIHYGLEMGLNFLDTADVYGLGHNEELLSRALVGKRDGVFLATKFGLNRISNGPGKIHVNCTPEYVQQACERSLKRLNVQTIDLYYMHRLDKQTPIEDTVGAMAKLVEQGKVRYLGLSEINAPTLMRPMRFTRSLRCSQNYHFGKLIRSRASFRHVVNWALRLFPIHRWAGVC